MDTYIAIEPTGDIFSIDKPDNMNPFDALGELLDGEPKPIGAHPLNRYAVDGWVHAQAERWGEQLNLTATGMFGKPIFGRLVVAGYYEPTGGVVDVGDGFRQHLADIDFHPQTKKYEQAVMKRQRRPVH